MAERTKRSQRPSPPGREAGDQQIGPDNRCAGEIGDPMEVCADSRPATKWDRYTQWRRAKAA
jgi:hypothetical protein